MENRDQRFRVTVDYGMCIEEALAAGKFDSFDTKITSGHFRSNRTLGKEEIEIVLFRPRPFTSLDEVVDTEQIWQSLAACRLRPVNIHELLSLGLAYPDMAVTQDLCIVGLGSEWRSPDGRPLVPALMYTIDCTSKRYRRVHLFFSHGSRSESLGLWHTANDAFASVPQ